MQVSHELLPMDSESWKQQGSITVVRSDLIWQQSENSREIRNRATVTTSEIITVIGIGQSPFHLPKV